ncbi:uncharacterized protein YkwD [Prosthecobacter fusiformis]|uniref:Uncharacterized protein YkwD n=1 Tax=Prosthecobacter fusiformis TaxID=48464 RepID=A0A4R7RRB3_9BACT|nr:immunoglobulin domain-containing protein [Prosthecobacter fusiformis]TDU68122.1 uncharacterized protein YkwD [Prosthecobacter fusiformis]
MKFALSLFVMLAVASATWGQATTLYSIGDPTDEEQQYLEMINRARANPAAEGLRMATSTDPDVLQAIDFCDVDLTLMQAEFNALPVLPPLAMNAKLTQMARGHTLDLLNNAFQGHVSSNGDTLTDRVTAVGYPRAYLGENVFSFAESVFHGHAGFQIDWEDDNDDGMQSPRGHRDNIHGDKYREAGIGVLFGTNYNSTTGLTVGPQLVTQNLGSQSNSLAYVTGVAYYDFNGNDFYDLGEGIGGLTVNVAGSSFHAVTTSSGGYAVPVPTTDTTRAVTFSGPGLNGAGSAVISGGNNVKVDFKPVYTPLTPVGPLVAMTETTTSYSFPAMGGATDYEWQSILLLPTANDEAENLDRITASTTGTYLPTSTTVKHSGTAGYRLTHPDQFLTSEYITYDETFLVKPGAELTFQSSLKTASEHQIAKVQVSVDDGVNWIDVYAQAGATPAGQSSRPGETSFNLRTVSLAAFEGQQIRIRFAYVFVDLDGILYLWPGTSDSRGWFIDQVMFNGLQDSSQVTLTDVADGETGFDFIPEEAGEYLLSVRPIIAGRARLFSPAISVAVTAPPVDITVKRPTNAAFVFENSSLEFGMLPVGASQVHTITLLNSGTETLTDLAIDVEGPQKDEFILSELEVNSLLTGGQTSFTVTFTPTVIGSRTATLSILSNDPNESPFEIMLSGDGSTALSIATPPRSQVAKLGAAVTFDVEAGPSIQSYQWKKNNAIIRTNGTNDEYIIPVSKLTDAGTYAVAVTGGVPVSTQQSTATLGVVEDIEKTVIVQEGKTVTLTAKAAGPDLKWEWKRNGATFGDSSLVLGRKTKTLTLKGVLTAQSGTYTCEVTSGDSEPTAGATTHVRIFNAAPEVNPTQGMDDGIVGGAYYHKIKVSDAFARTPLTYAAKNLPAGLKLNTKTGEITGRPTKAEATRVITVSAKNTVVSTEVSDTITIHDYPENLEGTYVGWVARNADLNKGLGGRLDLKITGLGAYSGSLTMGTMKMSFKGSLDILADGSELPTAEVEIQPPDKSAKMKLVLVMDNEDYVLATDTKVSRNGQEAAITGWRQKWDSRVTKATAYLGLHTFGLRLLPAGGLIGNDNVPQGWGYGSFTTALDGKISVTGRTADGEKFTTASFVGPEGEIFIYQTLYTTTDKGSLLGTMTLDLGNLGTPEDTADNTLDGSFTWTRPKNTSVKARIYKDGFGLVDTPVVTPVVLEATGARFMPPTGENAVILGLLKGNQNAEVDFEYAGIEAVADHPSQDLNILDNSKITLFNTPGKALLKLTASVKTGLLSGSFTLMDVDLRPSTTKPFKRTVTLQGMLIQDGAEHLGVGYFLLPGLPTAEVPVNTIISSGKMTISPR